VTTATGGRSGEVKVQFSVVADGRPVRTGRLRRQARRRGLGGAAGGVALMVAATGCQGGFIFESAKKASAGVDIAPADGGGRVAPDSPISIQVRGGKIQDVTIKGKGGQVEGRTSAGGRLWQSRWTLRPATRYWVTATALGADGRTKSVTSTFQTLRPKRTFQVKIEAPTDKEKVGVGMPIVLKFSRPVVHKARVERALEVRMSRPVEGAWHWDGKQRVIFRTKQYWPRGQRVDFVAHISGLPGIKNGYGDRDAKASFNVGNKMVSTINTKTHQMTVKRNGKKVKKIPISAGRGGVEKYTTTNGVHLAMSMEPHVRMTSPDAGPGSPGYYSLDVDDAIRISDSGEYVHGAPWSVGSQGSANVSHGCVNASPDDADWLRRKTHRGDIIKITGTDRELEWNNGWGFWQMSWGEWVKGSALKQSINPGAFVPEPSPPPSPTPSPTPSATPSPVMKPSSPSPSGG
jgi:lipoprotein-anchoring transpeptidase ErfK/SrfK